MNQKISSLQSKHRFSFFYQFQTPIVQGQEIVLNDPGLIHRLLHVIRITQGYRCILFHDTIRAEITVLNIKKQIITIKIDTVLAINPLKPALTFLIPILKRNALEEAISNAIETGISSIQLYESDHQQRAWGGQKELERLINCARGAAEQAKLYEKITIAEPQAFQAILSINKAPLIVFHQTGQIAAKVVETLEEKTNVSYTLCIGPEADFSQEELQLLSASNTIICLLTPTILRAPQAVAVGGGLLRSLLAEK